MGFSVSGSLAVVVVGSLLAFSMAYTAGANGFERIDDARESRNDRVVEQRNAAIEIANVTYDGGNETLRVTVNNTGTTSLPVNGTDILADNTYITNETTTVAGDDATDLWLPGEQLTAEASLPNRPDAVTIVTEHGLSERTVV